MTLKTWLTHGDVLYKKQLTYDAMREWEGAFTRAFRALPQANNYQEVAFELVKRLEWLQADDKHHDAEQLTKKLYKILQRTQKDEKVQLNFFNAMMQELVRLEHEHLIFLLSKSLLTFSMQHASSLEHDLNTLSNVFSDICQKVHQSSSIKNVPPEHVISTWRFILFILLTKMQFNNSESNLLFDTCSKTLEDFMMSEQLEPSKKATILVEFTVFLSLLNPTASQIRTQLSRLKELSQKHEDIGKRQHLIELREKLVQLIQAIRNENKESYFNAKTQLLSLLGAKDSLLSPIFKKIEQKYGFKQTFPLFPF